MPSMHGIGRCLVVRTSTRKYHLTCTTTSSMQVNSLRSKSLIEAIIDHQARCTYHDTNALPFSSSGYPRCCPGEGSNVRVTHTRLFLCEQSHFTLAIERCGNLVRDCCAQDPMAEGLLDAAMHTKNITPELHLYRPNFGITPQQEPKTVWDLLYASEHSAVQ